VIRKVWSFVRRDWESERSYRLASFMAIGGMVMPLIGLYFISKLLGELDVAAIEQYGGNYVTFLLVGLVVTGYSGVALGAFVGALRGAQVRGTLEPLLLTRATLPVLFLGWSAYPVMKSTLFLIIYATGAFFVAGISFSSANFGAAAIVMALIIVVLGSLGLMSASFALVFKQSDPLTRGIVVASGFLSGAAFPVTLLPGWLQVAGKALPQTYAIEAARLAVLRGAPLSELASSIGALLIYAAVMLPISIWVFHRAMRQAKMDGSLAHY
jgi:ABC-2 type transport system permease protein